MLQNQAATTYKRPAEGGLAVNFPETLLIAAKEDADQFRRRVLVQTLGSLYVQGKISSGLGMQLLECDRWEFYRLLTENGFAVLDYAEDQQEYEVETSRMLAEQKRSL
jgi:predicted HTH domain antitoxin